MFQPLSNLRIVRYWSKVRRLSLRTAKDEATSTGIGNPQLIFSGKLFKYYAIMLIKHGITSTTSNDINPVAKRFSQSKVSLGIVEIQRCVRRICEHYVETLQSPGLS
jgi:hypothetical protein